MTPQDAKTIADYLVADLQQEIPTTVNVIKAAPEGGSTYTPDEKSMTGIALIRHLVAIDAWFLNSIANGSFDGSAIDPMESLTSPAEAGLKYNTLVSEALARVSAMSPEQLAGEIDFFGLMKPPAASLLGMMIKHSVHHRGQLSTYLRPMGGKVPSIYGSSADTK